MSREIPQGVKTIAEKIPWVKKTIAEKKRKNAKNTNAQLESQTNSFSTEMNPLAPEER